MNKGPVFALAVGSVAAILLQAGPAASKNNPQVPTFYRDVQPILEKHCQSCHRPGEMAFPLVTYGQAAPRAHAIRDAVVSKKMPPWLADPRYGHFANDPTLASNEIETLTSWVESGARAGDPHEAPAPLKWTEGWNISPPDTIFEMPKTVSLPARGDIEYTYEIIPTHFREDRWVQMAELRPSNREQVHHAVVYIRPPDSKWLRSAPVGVPFTADTLKDEQGKHDAHWTDSDLLIVYAPGSSPEIWANGMAKFIPAGSDLVIQMHYMPMGRATSDRSAIGLVFAKQPPRQRVLTLQLTNSHFVIPPRAYDYRVEARGSLPNDATILGFFPHMHWRGKKFEFNLIHPGGRIDPLLQVRWDFEWQLTYQLADPLPLKAGTVLQAVAWYDNSKGNPHNPNPNEEVRWGDQTYEEMMVGFFDVAVAPDIDKWKYFIRGEDNSAPPR